MGGIKTVADLIPRKSEFGCIRAPLGTLAWRQTTANQRARLIPQPAGACERASTRCIHYSDPARYKRLRADGDAEWREAVTSDLAIERLSSSRAYRILLYTVLNSWLCMHCHGAIFTCMQCNDIRQEAPPDLATPHLKQLHRFVAVLHTET